MKQTKRNVLDRIFAMILSIMMVIATMPINVFAVGRVSSELATDIEEKVFTVGEATEFTFTTIANDDAGISVKGTFEFSDPDAIESLEYWESQDGNWYPLTGDFGPADGFSMTNATSRFRAKFNRAGTYSVTVSMKQVNDRVGAAEVILCSKTATVNVQKKSSELVTDIEEKVFTVGETTEFTFTTIANDDAGISVKGTFVFSDPDALESLEYWESQDGNWYPLTGDFGPADGFPMTNAMSRFRATFNRAGTYSVTVSMKQVDDLAGAAEVILCSKTARVTVEKKVAVTASSNSGGTVSLNDDTSGSVTIDADTTVNVKVQADNGYRIASLQIGDTTIDSAAGAESYSSDVLVSENTIVTVTFVKVWTVTVTHTGNGRVNITPVGAGGSVTVEEGADVVVSAVPDPYYNVSRVIINGTEDTSFVHGNDVGYTRTLRADREYTVEITFAPNTYHIAVNSPANGTVRAEAACVEYNGNTKVFLVPDEGYTIDTITVNGASVTSVTQDEAGIYFSIDNISADQTVAVTFKETEKAAMNALQINSDEALRVDDSETLFVMKEGSSILFSTEKTGIRLYDNSGALIGGAETEQSVSVTQTAQIAKIELYYQADDEFYADWHAVEMEEISVVVDKGDNVTASLTLTSEANPYGYYNADVTLAASAEDTGDYSGIALVEYWITCNGVDGTRIPLYTYADGDIRNTYAENIVVDAARYNSKDVKVTLRVVDRAGNEKIAEQALKINSTAPSVALDITGTQKLNALDGYYNSERELTITVIDREDTFNAKAVADGMSLKVNGNEKTVSETDITWTHSGNTHIGTYPFSDDAAYEWSFSYTNKAGMTNQGVAAPADKNIYKFTIDTAEPYNLKVTYDPGFFDTIIDNIFYGFYQAPVQVTIEATDDTAGVEQFKYSYTVEEGASLINAGAADVTVDHENITYDGTRASVTFDIPAQFRGKVSFSATDRAGHTSFLVDGRIVVVDNIAPGVTVFYDNNDVHNGKYYAANRTATIQIEEANFFKGADIDDAILVINKETQYNDGTVLKENNIKPEFHQKGDIYTAEIPFEEEADYIFEIKYYADRSGNVCDFYMRDEFTIDKTKPIIIVDHKNNTCINGDQFNAERPVEIQVIEHNFDPTEIDVTGETDIKKRLNDADYSFIDSYGTYLKDLSKWHQEGDVYTAEITFPGDAHYTFSIGCTDLAGNENEGVDYKDSVVPERFTVDKTEPENLKISYEPEFIGVVLDNITYGFYNAPVQVTIEATDITAGIDSLTYACKVQENASSINVGIDDTVVDRDHLTFDGAKASAKFTIDPQFRGYVSFTAIDRAGNSASLDSAKLDNKQVVVIDTIAPELAISYDNNNVQNGKYYNADRTATIWIKEANFFAQDRANDPENHPEKGRLILKKTAVYNDGTKDETYETPKFQKATDVDPLAMPFEDSEDVYKAEILFNEDADYTFYIEYTDRSGNVSSKTDEFTVDKIKPELSIAYDNNSALNETYYNANRTATITVKEHNAAVQDGETSKFRTDDIEFTIVAKNVAETREIDLSAKNYVSYLKNPDNWVQKNDDEWETQITFDIEGNYVFDMKYKDLAGNEQKDVLKDAFCIDWSDPVGLRISYDPDFFGRFLNTFLGALTYGFYKEPVRVTIEAVDEYAGIDYFVYSYEVQQGASSINTGMSKVRTPGIADASSKNIAKASFMIPPQFRGFVSFVAFDKAGNKHDIADENAVVVDNIAPGVSVAYDNNQVRYSKYYNADRTATIKIDEANFFAEDVQDGLLVISVGKTLVSGTHTDTIVKPDFTETGSVYTATVPFTENADYTFDIKYTDRSGNVFDSYDMDQFTVDKINPIVEVSYDNNSCKNGDQFNADREATITIKEHNFDASDVVAKVTADGVEVSSYARYLADGSNWTHKGDIHTAKIQYTEEAHYTFDISYTDMAGNQNDGVIYGTAVAPTKFTLDKSAPTDLTIKIDDVSVLGTNSIAFDTFYAKKVTIKLAANCDISGKQSFQYQKVASVSAYNENGTWTDYDSEKGIAVSPSEKFILYFRAEDRAGNVSIVNSTGIVVDNQKPAGETNAPEIDILPEAANENGVYSKDVSVKLKVVDPKYHGGSAVKNGYYSGLNKITYRIYTTDTDAVKEGTLLDLAGSTKGAVFDADKLINSWTGKITIDSEQFNSNHVFVEVTATDNAGNTRTSTTADGDIKIDITAPTIDVSYDNNQADNTNYFKEDRTATIVVTERNFSAEDVAVTLSNTEGVLPVISNWTETKGSGNMDDSKWTARISYTADGDYDFAIAYTDLAGWTCENEAVNYGDSVAPTAFTIDHTVPTVTVSYNNNSASNTNYYKEARIATIDIMEHNLDPNGADRDRITITMTATDNGAAKAVPAVSTWRTNGDHHIATIQYNEDAFYTFDVAVRDKAGNESADFAEQSFYVDQTAPTLEITGVADLSANNGDVIPVISYSDTNYDASQVAITLTGANRKEIELDGAYANIQNGGVFTFKNFAKTKEMDDIYTLTAALTDKAGNVSTQTIMFSVNRFGSTYALSESTEKLNGTYVKEPIDVVVVETNPDKLSNIKVTLFKNGETIVLTEGSDYEIVLEGGNGQWYHYSYVISAKNFAEDGVYSLTLESDDAAGNAAKNNQDTKGKEINFGIDSTLPIINIENLDSKTTYATETLTVSMSIADNLKLARVIVELDGKEFKVWSNEELEEIVQNGGNFAFDITGDSTSAHQLVVYAVDAAGNGDKISNMEMPVNAEEVKEFYVTTNLWVRYYTNKPLFFGSIGGVTLIAGASVSGFFIRRRKIL